jgi:hypothetical protein
MQRAAAAQVRVKSLTAKDAEVAREQNSLTAKDAEAAKENKSLTAKGRIIRSKAKPEGREGNAPRVDYKRFLGRIISVELSFPISESLGVVFASLDRFSIMNSFAAFATLALRLLCSFAALAPLAVKLWPPLRISDVK